MTRTELMAIMSSILMIREGATAQGSVAAAREILDELARAEPELRDLEDRNRVREAWRRQRKGGSHG